MDQLSLDFILSGGGDTSTMAQIYQADLAKIGVTLNIKVLKPPAWRSATASLTGWQINGASSDYSQLLPSSLATMSAWWSYAASGTGFRDDQYTQLATAITVEVDPTRQQQVYAQWRDFVLDQAFSIPIAQSLPRRS